MNFKIVLSIISIVLLILFSLFTFVIYKSFNVYSQKESIEFFKLNEIKLHNIKFEYYTATGLTLFYFKANYDSIDDVKKYLVKHNFIELDMNNLGKNDFAVESFFKGRNIDWWHPPKNDTFQIYTIENKIISGKYIYCLFYLDEKMKNIFTEFTVLVP